MNTQHTHHKSTKTTELVSHSHKKTSQRSAIGMGIVVFLTSAALSLMFSGGTAQADALPPRPSTPVPFEQPAQPTDAPADWSLEITAVPSTAKGSEPMAYIELGLPPSLNANAQTVVQWQDKQGGWHDVEGWQQRVGLHQSVRWVVYPRDFGSGPFRWAVYNAGGKGDQLMATSATFSLPCCDGNTLRLEAKTAK